LAVFGFTINLLTLMALVLAIGLVVDDSIVVLENVQRRVDTLGEPRVVAAQRGARQVFFAIVATSAVLVAVFAPMLFVGGYVGKLFVELSVTVAGVVVISAFAALSLSPVMCAKLVKPAAQSTRLSRFIDKALNALRASYRASLEAAMQNKAIVFGMFAAVMAGGLLLFTQLSSELTPAEDRGMMMAFVNAPEGSGFEYTSRIIEDVESTLMEYVESGEVARFMVVLPGFGDAGTNRFSSGFAMIFLEPWGERRPATDIVTELNQRFSQIPGATVRVIMPNAFQRGGGDGASIVLLGSEYEPLAATGERIM